MKKGESMPDWLKEKIRQSNLGQKRSPETCEKFSSARKGKAPSQKTREACIKAMIGNKFALGNKLSEETRAKMSAAKKGIPKSEETKRKLSICRLGEKNYRWRGGHSKDIYPPGWNALTQKIRERDDHLCQHPGCYMPEIGRVHHVHHIDFDKNNINPENLITLCRGHHVATYVGEKEYWSDFYSNVQLMRGLGSPGV